jgi:23S rRNA (cytosine1962-C5)-methyltransferase
VVNLDVSESALESGRRNAAQLRATAAAFETIRADALPAMRALAGMAAVVDRRNGQGGQGGGGGRGGRAPPPRGGSALAAAERSGSELARLRARAFALCVLDPPTFAKGNFGAVDIVRDYQSLLKPALLLLEPGGALLATNHAAGVPLDDWLEACARCAAKAGRPLSAEPQVLEPDGDFPPAPWEGAGADGAPTHLLKMAVLRVG